jgi:heme-degrading monooxygenase HmoA
VREVLAVRILIHRKVRAGKEEELGESLRELRSKAIHARGYISGETLRSIEDPSVHLVISTWTSLEDWNNWLNASERKALQKKIDLLLEEPPNVTSYEYELFSGSVRETLGHLNFSGAGE